MSILFIVESPGKIKQISSYLGKNYIVAASVGHFRDLDKKSMSIDFANNFNPIYVITKQNVVTNLKSLMKKANAVYLAPDLDREGEAIAQHLYDVLKPRIYKRIVFNAITKSAILSAISNAGIINKNLVNAQKARRIIDRLYGYMISPLLITNIGGKLSAGRVQSVATKIIIDKENDIINHIKINENSSYFKINATIGDFKCGLMALDTNPNTKKEYTGKPLTIKVAKDKIGTNAIAFLKRCLKSTYTIHYVSDKISVRKPSAPFETYTLQQEANRKLGMTVDTTMKVAQKLYENGYITYMRTDSIEISEQGHDEIKKVIVDKYGKKYYQKNKYENKSANAQEAHEAIRPTHLDLLSLKDEINDNQQIKLYKLIWQRTIASQMKPAQVNVTSIQIDISEFYKLEPFNYLQSFIENIIFMGFMIVYTESVDDEIDDSINAPMKDFKGLIPKIGTKLTMIQMTATQEYIKPPPRYTQSSLVGTLKKMEIGRPSTYVNTIKTIIDREYVKIDNVKGIEKDCHKYTIASKKGKNIMNISEEINQCLVGKETKKLMPTQLGMTVNDYLVKNFPDMIDYKFTAKMEKELDDVSTGTKNWLTVVKKYYDRLAPTVELISKSNPKSNPTTSTDTLLGKLNGYDIHLLKSKFGYYLKKTNGTESSNAKLPSGLNPTNITIKDAKKIFAEKESSIIDTRTIKSGSKTMNVVITNGKYGPYIKLSTGKKNTFHNIPKTKSADKLTDTEIIEIINYKQLVDKPNVKSSGSKTVTKPIKSTKSTKSKK